MVCLQVSFQQIFSVNKLCGLLIIFPYPAVSHVFQGPGSSGSRFFRVQVFQGPGPASGSKVRVQGPGSGSMVRVQVLEVAPYPIETSPLICRATQWTGFYMIKTAVMKELTSFSVEINKKPRYCHDFSEIKVN